MSKIIQRKYGVATTIPFSLIEVDGVDFRVDAVYAIGDVKITKDEGDEGDTASAFIDEGSKYSIALSAIEMQAARISLILIDQTATKVWLDTTLEIETYGNASAQHAFDLDTASVAQTADHTSAIADIPTVAEFNARTLVADNYFDSTSDLVTLAAVTHTGAIIPTVSTLTGHTAQTGDNYATLTAGIVGRTNNANLNDYLQHIINIVESHREHHSHISPGETFYVDPTNGATHASGARGGISDPYLTIQDCHDNAVTDSNHDLIMLIPGTTAGATIHTIAATTTISKRYTLIRGPGRGFIITRTGNGDTLAITGEGVELEGVQIGTGATGSGDGISITKDFAWIHNCWINDTQGDGININQAGNCIIEHNRFQDTGVGGSGDGIEINGTGSSSSNNIVRHNIFEDVQGDAIKLVGGVILDTIIDDNIIHGSSGWAINISADATDTIVSNNIMGNNSSGDINDLGVTTTNQNNDQWAKHSIATETRLAELDAANIPADLDAVLVDTNDLQTNQGNWLTATGFNTGKTGYSLSATGLDSIVSTSNGMIEISKSVWDRIISKANHDIPQSAGKSVRNFTGVVIRNELAQGSGTGDNQIQLDTNASTMDGAYDPALVAIIAGTGAGQARNSLQYNGATKTLTVDRNWKVKPDATSEFNIIADAGREHVNEGLARGGSANKMILNALASSNPKAYIGQICFIRSGTGDDQSGVVIAYNETTKEITIDSDWGVVPDTTSGYVMLPSSPVILANTTHTGAVIPTVIEVTNRVTANSDQIAGSATAATNLSKSAIAVEPGTAVTGTLSTTEMTTNLTEATDDHYIGRIIIWTSGVLKNQATDVKDYTGADKKLTFTATTEAPANNDTFVIL